MNSGRRSTVWRLLPLAHRQCWPLPEYLNEFVFRFNRRRTPMTAFQTLLGLTSEHQPITYKMLYRGESTG